MNQVILVNSEDKIIGFAEKLYAHKHNLCHRAFSVVLTRTINSTTQILLQQRQTNKYHCANLWSNTCCSHPQPKIKLLTAAVDRLNFEMGIVCDLNYVGAIYYQTNFNNQLSEHEYDHIFHGEYNGDINNFNTTEVSATKWIELQLLQQQLKANPQQFTPWLTLVLNKLLSINIIS